MKVRIDVRLELIVMDDEERPIHSLLDTESERFVVTAPNGSRNKRAILNDQFGRAVTRLFKMAEKRGVKP